MCWKEEMNKKLGVIGGLGTQTAAKFYMEAEHLFRTSGQPNHIPIMIDNCQSSFALEQSLIKGMERMQELKSSLCSAAKNLEKGGSTVIALPCNTAHVHIDAVRESVEVPVLSITEEVAKKLQSLGVQKAVILGTKVTKESGIYTRACAERDIFAVFPSQQDQKIIEHIISRALLCIHDQSDEQKLLQVIKNSIAAGADAVVLACTDLQLCMPKGPLPNKVIDSMQTLCDASVQELIDGV